jgi:hypothetical protein
MLRRLYELKHLSDNLREAIRQLMLEELLWACRHSKVYASKYLTTPGLQHYPRLLHYAVASGSPDSLCYSLSAPDLWRPGAPANSIETFAWDEFNKYYMRALCRFAQDHPKYALIVVRGRQSGSHRRSSENLISQAPDPLVFLQQLRLRPAINPFGANSGLTLTLQLAC